MTTATVTEESIQEFTSSQGLRLGVREGVIEGVKILGTVSKNGRRYPEATIRAAAHKYEGAKVNVDHPLGSPLKARSYTERLGELKNVEIRQDGLYCDLHYNPKHAIAEQLAWDAEHSPGNVGLSHNILARTKFENGETIIEDIARVVSVDLVADPAATRGLFENKNEGGSDMANTQEKSVTEAVVITKELVEKFLADNPEYKSAIQERFVQEAESPAIVMRDKRITALVEENAEINAKLHRSESESKRLSAKGFVDKVLLESGIVSRLLTETFAQDCYSAYAEGGEVALDLRLQDRRLMEGTVVSREQRQHISLANIDSDEDFVRAITS